MLMFSIQADMYFDQCHYKIVPLTLFPQKQVDQTSLCIPVLVVYLFEHNCMCIFVVLITHNPALDCILLDLV